MGKRVEELLVEGVEVKDYLKKGGKMKVVWLKKGGGVEEE